MINFNNQNQNVIVAFSPAYKVAGVSSGKTLPPPYGKIAVIVPPCHSGTEATGYVATGGRRAPFGLPISLGDLDASSRTTGVPNPTSAFFAPVYGWEEIPNKIGAWLEEGKEEPSGLLRAVEKLASDCASNAQSKGTPFDQAAELQKVCCFVRDNILSLLDGKEPSTGDYMSPDGATVWLSQLHLAGTTVVPTEPAAPPAAEEPATAAPAAAAPAAAALGDESILIPIVVGKHPHAAIVAEALPQMGMKWRIPKFSEAAKNAVIAALDLGELVPGECAFMKNGVLSDNADDGILGSLLRVGSIPASGNTYPTVFSLVNPNEKTKKVARLTRAIGGFPEGAVYEFVEKPAEGVVSLKARGADEKNFVYLRVEGEEMLFPKEHLDIGEAAVL